MATKTFRLGSGADGNFGALFEADQSAASRTDGWTCGTTAAARSSDFDAGTKKATGTFSTTLGPTAFVTSSTANAFKIPAALKGTFANTAWTFTFAVRSTTGTAQRGRMRMRVYKASNAAGTTGVVELTGATQIGTTLSSISTSADNTTVVTWSPGAAITLDFEFLFFVIAWETTTAGSSSSADVVMRTGQSAAGSRLVTPDFADISPFAYGVLDNFNRANGSVGASWTGSVWPGYAPLDIVSNQAKAATSPPKSSSWGVPYGPDCEVYFTVVTRGASEIDLFLRAGNLGLSNFFGYELSISGSTWTLYVTTNGGAGLVSIGSGTQVVANGSTIGFKIVGSVISAYYKSSGGNWVLVLTATDSVITAGGYMGVELDGSDAVLDDFGGGGTAMPTSAAIGRIPVVASYVSKILADSPTGYWRMDEAGLPQDSSPTGNHMTQDIRTVAQVTGLLAADSASKARGFVAAGGGSFLNRGGLLYPLNTFSIEFWIKRTLIGEYGEVILDQYNGGFQVLMYGTGEIALAKSYAGVAAMTEVLKIADTNTHHVVITRNGIGGAIVFYLDGVSETPTPFDSSHDFSGGANNGLFIGSQWGNSPLEATLDELAIYPTVLSAAKVAAHYNAGAIVTTGTSVVRGITLAQAGYPISVGKRISATAVRGITIVPGSATYYGSTSLAISFNATTAASRKTFGTIAVPVAFGATTQARRKTFGTVAVPVAFSATTQARRKTFGMVAVPVAFSATTQAKRKTFGVAALSISFSATTSGIRIAGSQTYYGSTAMAISFGAVTQARRKTFGVVAIPTTFGAVVQGRRKTFSSVSAPFTVAITVQGRRVAMGVVSMPITVTISTAGYSLSPYTVINKADRVYVGANQASRVYAGTTKVWGP